MPPKELELAESSIWVWTWKDMVKRKGILPKPLASQIDCGNAHSSVL